MALDATLPYFSSWAIAAICSTRSWWAAKSDSKASCFFFRAFNSFNLQWRKSWLWSISSFPRVHSSWMSDLCLNFCAKCSSRSSLKLKQNLFTLAYCSKRVLFRHLILKPKFTSSFQPEAIPRKPFHWFLGPSKHLLYPINHIQVSLISLYNTFSDQYWKFKQNWWRTDTILPSVGMYAGRLESRSFVCKVLKLVSSFAFCSTRGGLCFRR